MRIGNMEKKLFLLDMDGTIYQGNQIFSGVQEFLRDIKALGGRYIFLTNNSSKSIDDYVGKLRRLGIDSVQEDFYTSAQATIRYLCQKGYHRLYVLGTEAFRQQLRRSHFHVSESPDVEIDCLVLGFDTELGFQKLEDACILLNRNIPYVATNPDLVCPTDFGYVPDCGSVAQMLQNAAGKLPVVIGKPCPEMAWYVIEQTGYSREDTIIVGDRLYTDIACGNRAGITTALVLSGESTRADIERTKIFPTFIFEDIQNLHAHLLYQERKRALC